MKYKWISISNILLKWLVLLVLSLEWFADGYLFLFFLGLKIVVVEVAPETGSTLFMDNLAFLNFHFKNASKWFPT
jgi:hypothetical protein